MKPSEHIQMRTEGKTLVASVLVSVAVLAGCGGSSGGSRSTSTVAKSAVTRTTASQLTTTTASPSPPVEGIEVEIPSLLARRFLPSRYTCDGGDLSIPLHWSGVPNGTAELALFILDLQPVDGKTFVDWAVAGLSPTLHGLQAGQLPVGALVGRNGFGRISNSICPARGQTSIYVVALFALPRHLPLKPGFDALALHEQVERLARVQGMTLVRYKRL
jgi:phosphatidylethanolamine-binding protein (PEBP) family uncharacterized protein